MAYNRRPLGPDGRAQMAFKPLIPQGTKPGPVDDELLCLFIDGTEGKPIATLVNFSCHPACRTDTSSLPTTRGWPRPRWSGSGVELFLFSLAPAGDVNPTERGWEGKRRLGRALARATLEALKEVRLPLRSFEVPAGAPEDDIMVRRVLYLRELFGEARKVEM